jgi:uncharacterized OB-fold protein
MTARDATAHRVEGHITRAAFPLPDVTWPRTAEFWAAAAREELVIPRCDGCGRSRWYPMDTCRVCDTGPYTWTATSGRGTLFSWVVATHAFIPAFADVVPFVPALVALDEDPGVRVPTRVVDCDPSALAFDMPVVVTFRRITFAGVEGTVMAPLFVPAPDAP